jgi:hypothetical protein
VAANTAAAPRKIVLADFKGLSTAAGRLVRAAASCVDANNVLFSTPGAITGRSGWLRRPEHVFGNVMSVVAGPKLGRDYVLAHTGDENIAESLYLGDGSHAWQPLTTINGASILRSDAVRMRGISLESQFYLTSDRGILQAWIDDTSGSLAPIDAVRYAGMPRGGLISVSPFIGTAMATGTERAYRVTWHRELEVGKVFGGPPTSRGIIRNSGFIVGAAVVTAYLPVEWGTEATPLVTGYRCRIWASRTATTADDEMYLLAELPVDATAIANGYVRFTDDTPDSFLSASPGLHTNSSNVTLEEANRVQGVLNASDPPPSASDIAYWKDRAWFADCTFRGIGSYSLIAQLADGDTVTISVSSPIPVSLTLTARTSPSTSTEFAISSGATPGDLELTLNFLARKIRELSTLVNVSPVFGMSGAFSTLVLENKVFGSEVNVGLTANKWSVSLGEFGIRDSVKHNQLVYSKVGRPGECAPQNFIEVGPSGTTILRIIPFRDRLVVFTDAGIYQVTGSSPYDFAVSPFDGTYTLIGPQLVAVCDDRVYAWCREGIVQIDNGGVAVISTPIENKIEAISLTAGGDMVLAEHAFAIGHTRQHKVLFWYPVNPVVADGTDTFGSRRWLVYDTRTGAWSTGDLDEADLAYDEQRTCACSDNYGRIILGGWTSADTHSYIYRANFARTDDYFDRHHEGEASVIPCSVAFQFLQPDPTGAVHWQQVLIDLDNDTENAFWQTQATGLTVTFVTDTMPNAPISVEIGPDDYNGIGRMTTARVEVPGPLRRARSLQVILSWGGVPDFVSISGVSLLYGESGTFARRT